MPAKKPTVATRKKAPKASAKPAAPAKKRATKKAASLPPSAKVRKAPAKGKAAEGAEHDVADVLAQLRRLATKENRDGLVRFGIVADTALGVSMGKIHGLAKRLGKSQALATELWATNVYEARLLTAFVADPALVTAAQMDQWCKDFDNWAVCDTLCFHLFDRTPHALSKIKQWSKRSAEFEKRAAFALLATVALHDKKADSSVFRECLPLIERAANDERNFVKKSVLWALRGIGGRRDPSLQAEALAMAERLAGSKEPAARWVGKSALRELTKAKAKRRTSS
jgi:3-methyladenine DNA glycosylase AlkD